MTLKILKQKVNISLTLDDEFIQYCKLNNIEDVEKFAIEVFNKGFTFVKYGSIPNIGLKTETKIVKAEPRKIQVDMSVDQEKPNVIIPKKIEKDLKNAVIKEVKQKDIYDE